MDAETKQEFGTMKQEFGTIKQEFAKVNDRLDRMMDFLCTKVALKTDLDKYATKDDLHALEDRMLTKMDAIAVSHKKHDDEIPIINERLERLEQKAGIISVV